jgi:PleD family two-component response regulator
MLSRFADARIVAIDDTPANLHSIEALMRRAALRHVHAVQNLLVALDTIVEVRPDLILLDLHMPQLDGFALLSQIARWAAGTYLPVLVLTADSTNEAAHKALAGGARDFLTKPFDVTDVLLRVRNLLETQELHQRLRRDRNHLSSELRLVRRDEMTRQASHAAKQSDVSGVLAVGGRTSSSSRSSTSTPVSTKVTRPCPDSRVANRALQTDGSPTRARSA